METMHLDYHELAVLMYHEQIRYWMYRCEDASDDSKRDYFRSRRDYCRASINFHLHRRSIGAAVPEDVALLARDAQRAYEDASAAETRSEYHAAMKRFIDQMRQAGHALARHMHPERKTKVRSPQLQSSPQQDQIIRNAAEH